MKIAIILRGHSYAPKYRSGVDFRRCTQSFFDNILLPLSSDNIVDVFICTYDNEKKEMIEEIFKPVKSVYLSSNNNQKGVLIEALKMHDYNSYDFLVISRFDLWYHKSIMEFNIEWDKLNILWRELESMWRSHKRVGDVFIALPPRFINNLIFAINQHQREPNLHKMYNSFIESGVQEDFINIMVDGFYDSNSDKMDNPIYKIARGMATQDELSNK